MLHLYSCTWAPLLPSICCFKSACSSCSSDPTFPGSARICSPFGLVSHLGLSNHLYSFQALSEEGKSNKFETSPPGPLFSAYSTLIVGICWNNMELWNTSLLRGPLNKLRPNGTECFLSNPSYCAYAATKPGPASSKCLW